MYLLNTHLLPSLYHELVFTSPTDAVLVQLDRTVRGAIRRWLRLPKDTTMAFIHTDCNGGGLGVPSLRLKIPIMIKERLEGLFKSDDPIIKEMIEKSVSFPTISKVMRGIKAGGIALSSRNDIRSHWRKELHSSVDGAGLKHHLDVSGGNRWVNSGGNLQTGRNYVSSIQTRGNLHYTKMRAARGRPAQAVACDACGRCESLSHVLQVCPKTCKERNSRHNKVVAYVSQRATAKGWKVRVEDPIPTPAGIRRPDLVVYKAGQAAKIIDVTIISDAARLSDGHRSKVKYYDTMEIRNHVSAYSNVNPSKVEVTSVTLNWRGALCRESDTLLTSLGFGRTEKELVSVRTVEGAYNILNAHRCGTWRAAGRSNGSC